MKVLEVIATTIEPWLEVVRADPVLRRTVPFFPLVVLGLWLLYRRFSKSTAWWKQAERQRKALSPTATLQSIKTNADRAEVLLTAFGAGRMGPLAFQKAAREALTAAVSQSAYMPDVSGAPLREEVFLFQVPVFLAEFYAQEDDLVQYDQTAEEEEKICVYSLAFRILQRSPALPNASFTTTGTRSVPMKKAIQAAMLDWSKQCYSFCTRSAKRDLPTEAWPTLSALAAEESKAGPVVRLLSAWALSCAAVYHYRVVSEREEERRRLQQLIVELGPRAQGEAEEMVLPVIKAVVVHAQKALAEEAAAAASSTTSKKDD